MKKKDQPDNADKHKAINALGANPKNKISIPLTLKTMRICLDDLIAVIESALSKYISLIIRK